MKWSAAVCLVTLVGIGAASAAAQNQASTPANRQQKALSVQSPAMRAGQAIYVDDCSACHTDTGVGLSGLFPPLKENPVVQASDASPLIHFVLEGGKTAASGHAPTGPAMPSFGWKLSDEQIAAVITYVRNSWGNAAPAVSPSDVRSIRKKDCTGLEARLHPQPSFQYFCKR